MGFTMNHKIAHNNRLHELKDEFWKIIKKKPYEYFIDNSKSRCVGVYLLNVLFPGGRSAALLQQPASTAPELCSVLGWMAIAIAIQKLNLQLFQTHISVSEVDGSEFFDQEYIYELEEEELGTSVLLFMHYALTGL